MESVDSDPRFHLYDQLSRNASAAGFDFGANGVALARAEGFVIMILGVISVILSTAILSSAFILWYLDKGRHLIRRCSVRILLQVQAISIPLAIMLMLGASAAPKAGFFCTVTPYLVSILSNVMSGLSAFVGVNLVCVLIYGLKSKYEIWILLLIWCLSIMAPTPSLLLKYYGMDPLHANCWLVLPAGAHRNIVTIGTTFIVPFLFATCSTICSIRIVLFLNEHKKTQTMFLTSEGDRHESTFMVLKVLIFPITSILLVLILSCSVLLSDKPSAAGKENWTLRFTTAVVTSSSPIVLGLELLLVDPTFNLRVIKSALRSQPGDREDTTLVPQSISSESSGCRPPQKFNRQPLQIENRTSVEMDVLRAETPPNRVV